MMEKLLLSLCAAAGILVAGCSDPSDGESDIRIAPSITRVDGVNFTEGDRIGVTVSLSSGDYAANRLMTYDGLFFSAAGLVWYDEAQGASTFTAYYPYRDEGVPGTFAVAADQRDGCTPSDLLGAVTRDVLPGSTPVKMQFHHLLSQLNIVVQNRSDRAVRQVAIDGFVPEAAVDLAVPEATVRAGEAVEVLAFAVTPNALYRAVLVPQRATLQVDVTLEDGTVASKSVPDAALEGGKRYDLSVVVEATSPTKVTARRSSTPARPTPRLPSTAGCGWPRTCATGLRMQRSVTGSGIPRWALRPLPSWACSMTMPR